RFQRRPTILKVRFKKKAVAGARRRPAAKRLKRSSATTSVIDGRPAFQGFSPQPTSYRSSYFIP
ncbi:MAG: hypothetical protein ACRDD1_19380, partial [Planctomycetia bacterium]